MRAIAITGGKGGVGKTTLSSGIAIALAQEGASTVLFDADLALANLDVVLGLRSEFTLQHVVNDEKTLREILHDGPGGVKVATGASGVGALMSAGPKRLRKFFTQVFAIEDETDFLIFDTGSGIDRRVMAFLKAADDVIVVITPDPTSLTDGYATIKQLHRTQKDASIHVVVNMADNEKEASAAFNALQTIVKQFLKREVGFLGFVPRDASAARLIRQRKPYLLGEPNGPASRSTAEIARKVKAWGANPSKPLSARILEEPQVA